jgi:hypothetical protein
VGELLTTTLTVNEAQVVHEEIRGAVTAMRNAWYWLAERLYRFHDQRMWDTLGYRSFDEYLASPEIELARRTVYSLVETWRVLVIEQGVGLDELADTEVSKVKEVLPAIRTGRVAPLAAPADVRTLGRDDLRIRYAQQGALLGSPHGPNGHPGYTVCPTCGSRVTAAL